jgi:glycosyltransferase involved in cell wall biosynthesis
MRLLLFSQYYPPEHGATQNRLESFTRDCRRNGVEVTVLTALPNYPRGQVYEGYRRRWCVRESAGGIDVIRAWIWTRPGMGPLARALSHLSFAVSALIIGWRLMPCADILVWESFPPLLGPTAYLLAKLKGARLITNVSDLWTASVRALNVLPEGTVLMTLERLESFMYCRSALIAGQTDHIVATVRSKVPGAVVYLWPNGADVGQEPPESPVMVRAGWGIGPERLVVGYAGMFGMSHGLETILQAASRVASPLVTFVLVGDGPYKARIEETARTMRLTNVVFVRSYPHASMPSVWQAFDCAIVCLRRLPLFRGAIPSKMFEAMSSGRPVILAVEGEAASVVEDSGAGLAIEPENPEAMAKAVDRLQADPDLRRQMGENGRRVVANRYNRARLNEAFIGRIREVANRGSSQAD